MKPHVPPYLSWDSARPWLVSWFSTFFFFNHYFSEIRVAIFSRRLVSFYQYTYSPTHTHTHMLVLCLPTSCFYFILFFCTFTFLFFLADSQAWLMYHPPSNGCLTVETILLAAALLSLQKEGYTNSWKELEGEC